MSRHDNASSGTGAVVAFTLIFVCAAAMVFRLIITRPALPPPAPAPAAYEPAPPLPSEGGGDIGGGGSVNVHGYTRRDGTVVRGYTRSAPGNGGGRR